MSKENEDHHLKLVYANHFFLSLQERYGPQWVGPPGMGPMGPGQMGMMGPGGMQPAGPGMPPQGMPGHGMPPQPSAMQQGNRQPHPGQLRMPGKPNEYNKSRGKFLARMNVVQVDIHQPP